MSSSPAVADPETGGRPQEAQAVEVTSASAVNARVQQVVPMQPAQPPIATPAWVDDRPLTAIELYLIRLLRYGRMVKLVALIDLAFTILNGLIQPITLCLVIGPLTGLYGALRYNLCLVTAYAVFSAIKALASIVQLVLPFFITLNYFVYRVIVFAVSALVQLWILKLVVQFRTLLVDLTEERAIEITTAAMHPQARRLIFW